jgi:NADPH:quinone reductase-like Zn-dependent oxidoreductase
MDRLNYYFSFVALPAKYLVMQKIPKRMRAIVQNSIGSKLEIVEIDTPSPQKGQVLVKMHYASINPSDLSLLQGTFKNKPNYPIIPGIEGSGIVVANGSGILPKLRLGKRVSCTSTEGFGGSWAEYMLTSAMHVIPIDKSIGLEQATSLIVNPLTALAFIDIAKKNNAKSILNNASAGALGKMLISMTKKENIDIISVVRTEEQKNQLENYGAKYVLNSTSENYLQELKSLTQKLDTRLYFDAIGGACTDSFIEVSPEGSQIYLYANLSEEKSLFNPRTLLQQEKSIQGFFLGSYSSNQNLLKTLAAIKKAQKLIHNELKTQINEVFEIEEINKAVELYSNNMSEGKVLLRFKE